MFYTCTDIWYKREKKKETPTGSRGVGTRHIMYSKSNTKDTILLKAKLFFSYIINNNQQIKYLRTCNLTHVLENVLLNASDALMC